MAFIPFIRAVGLAFTIAMMFPVSNEWKWQTGLATAAGGWWKRVLLVLTTVIPFAVWSIACASRQGELPYSWWFALERFSAVWEWTRTSFGFYVDSVADYGLGRVPIYFSILLVVLPVLGMIATRGSGGFTILPYFVIYLIVVSVYPCRHPRLVWPLVPFALIWGARGFESLVTPWLEPTCKTLFLKPILLSLGTLWFAAQVFVCASWMDITQGFGAGPQRWGDLPWHAWGDWQAAAEWLKGNTPEHARVLTRNKSLGLWSDRLQAHVLFERMSASELEDAIRTTRAQYVVLGYWGAGALMPMERMNRNPVYSFEQMADFQGVRIYRVTPNRSGQVSDDPPDYSPLLASFDMNQIVSEPGEEEEITRCHLLRRAGRAAEAIPMLEQRVHRSLEVPYALELANCLIDVGEYPQAIAWYRRAAETPGGDLYRVNIAAGIQVAEQFLLLEDPNASLALRVDATLRIAAAHIEMGRYQPALTLIERGLELSPSNPACLYSRGAILQRLGRDAEAIESLEMALQHGARDAFAKLLLLKTAEVIDAPELADIYLGDRRIVVDPTTSQDHLNLATLANRDGIPGFGLAVLERAEQRFPNDAAVSKKLGELYELFGEWELAAAAWNRAMELQPDHQTTALLHGIKQKMSQPPRP
jgi:tetratricopeptide (TPR) repeat protein